MRPPSPGGNEAFLFPLDSVDIHYNSIVSCLPRLGCDSGNLEGGTER